MSEHFISDEVEQELNELRAEAEWLRAAVDTLNQENERLLLVVDEKETAILMYNDENERLKEEMNECIAIIRKYEKANKPKYKNTRAPGEYYRNMRYEND